MQEYIKGLVSVVIPTYKRSDLLMKAIESVLNQTYRNLELLVVNDNVKGDEYSLELYKLVEPIKDKRFKLVEQEKHINGAAARNAGIRVAKGEYIAFQDDDDYWEPEKIEEQVKLLSSLDSTWGAVACMKRFYNNGVLTSVSYPYRSGNILTEILDTRISLGTGAVLIRREALDRSGYFDEKLFRNQDLQLFARLASKYKIKLDKVYLHNREVKDDQNRPTVEKLNQIKANYFRSVQDLIDSMPKHVQKRIYALHNFDCAYVCFKQGDFLLGFKKSAGLLTSPSALFIAIKKIYVKIVTSKCKDYLNKKYSKRRR